LAIKKVQLLTNALVAVYGVVAKDANLIVVTKETQMQALATALYLETP